MHGETKLSRFLKKTRTPVSSIAREAGYSRVHIHNVREGRVDPSRECIAAVVQAARILTGQRVSATDLFDFESPRRRAS